MTCEYRLYPTTYSDAPADLDDEDEWPWALTLELQAAVDAITIPDDGSDDNARSLPVAD